MSELRLLTIAGLQVPVIELFDVVESTGLSEPEQNGAIVVKVGTTLGLTTIVIVTGVTVHCPKVGAKV